MDLLQTIPPGTRCVIVASPCLGDQAAVGTECVVVGMDWSYLSIYLLTLVGHVQYDIEIGAHRQSICGTCLKPKPKPDSERGDWTAIEKASSWKPPIGVPEHAA